MRASLLARSPFVLTAAIALALVTCPVRAQVCLLREDYRIPAPDVNAPERFGSSVSVNGDRVVVGYYLDLGDDSGSAYIFRNDTNGTPLDPSDDRWVQEAWLTASDGATDDYFGSSVSIEAGRVVIGAPFDDDAGRNSGSAYVFRFEDNGTPLDPSDDLWVEEVKLTALDAHEGDLFGISVSISLDHAIVGAMEDDGLADGAGSAYVFRRDDNDTPDDPSDDLWVQEAELTASDGAAVDRFGISVAISDHRAVVGARLDDDAGRDSGSAYVFRHDDNGTPSDPSDDFWIEEDKLTASDAAAGDQFGTSVSISGDRAVVGAHLDDDAGTFSGSAYVFRRDDNTTPLDPSDDLWVQEDKLTALDAAGGDRFGVSVSISGDRIIVGAVGDDDACSADPTCQSGSAYVFHREDNGTSSDATDDFWAQHAKLVASDTGKGDAFGSSVSISGAQGVVAAHLDDDYRGEDSGSVYIFSDSVKCTDLFSYANFQSCFSGTGGDAFTDIEVGLVGVFVSSVSWGDYDSDEDLDLALAGWTGSDYVSRIYRNDGGGTFTDIGADLTGVAYASLDWGDYDKDSDLDLALAGDTGSDYVSRIYRNDGGGTFTDIGAGLTGVAYASLSWGDYDKDEDLDLALAGDTGSDYVSQIYRNDGGGTFRNIGAGLTGVGACSLSWGDYDNDGDLDLVLAGNTGSAPEAKIYRNNGGMTFTDIGAGLTGVSAASLSWGDYDNDGDLDLVLAGNTGAGPKTKIYRNYGSGSFVDIEADLTGVFLSSLSWGDYDNDRDLDLVLAGHTGSGPETKIYRNDHGGVRSGCQIFDFDGDNHVDLYDYYLLLLTFEPE